MPLPLYAVPLCASPLRSARPQFYLRLAIIRKTADFSLDALNLHYLIFFQLLFIFPVLFL